LFKIYALLYKESGVLIIQSSEIYCISNSGINEQLCGRSRPLVVKQHHCSTKTNAPQEEISAKLSKVPKGKYAVIGGNVVPFQGMFFILGVKTKETVMRLIFPKHSPEFVFPSWVTPRKQIELTKKACQHSSCSG